MSYKKDPLYHILNLSEYEGAVKVLIGVLIGVLVLIPKMADDVVTAVAAPRPGLIIGGRRSPLPVPGWSSVPVLG